MAHQNTMESLELSSAHAERGTDTLQSLNTEPADPDNIIQASRIADSTVPDGGYGWYVLFGCGVLTFWFVGTSYCWGVIQAALVEQNLSSASTLSFVGSTTAACIAFLALINARVIRILGARRTGLLGVSLLGAGGILSGFTTHNVGGLFFTVGVVEGVGTSLCFMVVSVTPAQYFSKRRGLANGIVYGSGGLGGAIISFAMDALIQRLGTAWTFRVIGFLTLATGLPAAWLIKDRISLGQAKFVDLSLLRDIKFIVLFLGCALATFPLLVPPFFLPLYSSSLGLSSSAGAGLLAGYNFSSAVGRVLCGFMCDAIGPLNTLSLSLLLSAGSTLVLWPASSSLGPLIAFVIINGAANGGFFSTMPTVVGSMFGSVRVSVAMGMIVTGWTGGYLMGSPIAGFLLDAYGGLEGGLDAYRPAIYYAGSMGLAACGLVAFVRLRQSMSLNAKL